MPVLDLNVLRLGAFELAERPDVPVAVVIDEAVELAKRFSTDNSGRFVNGVLSALAADLRPTRRPTAASGASRAAWSTSSSAARARCGSARRRDAAGDDDALVVGHDLELAVGQQLVEERSSRSRAVGRAVDDDPLHLLGRVVAVGIVGRHAGDAPVGRDPRVRERVDLVAVAEVRDDVVRRRHGGVVGDAGHGVVEDVLAGVAERAASSPSRYSVLIGEMPHATDVASADAATSPTPKRRSPAAAARRTPSTVASASTARMIAV